jgi:hypothetical protein
MVTKVPDLLGREDRDRVDEAQFPIANHLLGREDSVSGDRHPLVSWLMGHDVMRQAGPLIVLVAAESRARRRRQVINPIG